MANLGIKILTITLTALCKNICRSKLRCMESVSPAYPQRQVSQLACVNQQKKITRDLARFNVIQKPRKVNKDVHRLFSHIGHRKKDPKGKRRPVPRLILLQNPITWLMVKIDFGVLRRIWDPAFVLSDFKYGTKQAISRVTQVISEGEFAELNGLLTKPARKNLMRELERNWSDRQRSLIALSNDDIQISAPRKVYFIKIAGKKFCDVDMTFLALKWVPINHIEALIFMEIFARFHREYTPHTIPEWTIAFFKVTRFQLLRR